MWFLGPIGPGKRSGVLEKKKILRFLVRTFPSENPVFFCGILCANFLRSLSMSQNCAKLASNKVMAKNGTFWGKIKIEFALGDGIEIFHTNIYMVG